MLSIFYSFIASSIGSTSPVKLFCIFVIIGYIKPELGKLSIKKSKLIIATIRLHMLQQHMAHLGQQGFAHIIVRPIDKKIMAGISTHAAMTSGFMFQKISSGVSSQLIREPMTGIGATVLFSLTKKSSPSTPHHISLHSLLQS